MQEVMVSFYWVDSNHEGPWTDFHDFSDIIPIPACGLLVKETEKYIVIATSINREGQESVGNLQIPKFAIVSEIKKTPL